MEAATQLSLMNNFRKGAQQIILHSQADPGKYPQNTNTCFKNSLHLGLRQETALCPQIQLVGLYSTTPLSQIQIQLDGVKSYFFGTIHKGAHKSLHIGSGSVERCQYWQVKNTSYFDLDLSNLGCWSVTILDRNGLVTSAEPNAVTVIELSIDMNPIAEAPKYLYFGADTLKFPTFLKIKPTCFASLLSFSHETLANVYPPHNQISIKQDCTTGNEVRCIQSSVVLPTDFYTLDKMVDCLNSNLLQFGISFDSKEGRLTIAKNRIGETQLRVSKKLAELIGCKVDNRLIGSATTFGLFDPGKTLPPVLALKCSALDQNGMGKEQQYLRLIFLNSKNVGIYEFEQKQPCAMASGYLDNISFTLETFPYSSPAYFAKDSQTQFSGCLEISHVL